jgi:serralysin
MAKPIFTDQQAVNQIIDRNKSTNGIQSAKWGSNSYGEGATITYSYLGSGQTIDRTFAGEPLIEQNLSLAEIQEFEQYIQLIEDVANVNLVRVAGYSDQGEIKIQKNTSGWGFGQPSISERTGPDLITSAVVTVASGFSQRHSIHEVLHTLGLSHPGPYDGAGFNYEDDAVYFQDSNQYSIMSYFDGTNTGASYGRPGTATLMIHDIMAIQYLYGANNNAFLGNTIYGFNSNTNRDPWTLTSNTDNMFGSIWDSGGIDTIDTSGYSVSETIKLTAGQYSSLNGETFNLSIAPGVVIENAIGGSGNDNIYGNSANNVLKGGIGNDYLFGDMGNDTLWGEDGNDLLYGGIGNDFVYGGNGNDKLNGWYGNDRLYGDAGKDTLEGSYDNDSLYGGSDNDKLDGGTGNDKLYGGTGNDYLFGDVGNDYLWGEDGNDLLYASGGNDTVNGGNGNDKLNGWYENDYLYGDAGKDTLEGSYDNDRLYGGSDNDNLDGGTGNDVLFGGTGNDYLFGDVGNDFLWGEDGNDLLYASGGNDTVDGGNGNDKLNGWYGNDFLYGGNNNDTLEGSYDNDSLYGASGNDSLNGGTESDFLDGGSGFDTLTSASVADQDVFFVSSAYLGSGYATITDFDLFGTDYDTIQIPLDYELSYSYQVGNGANIDTIIKDKFTNDWLAVLQDVQLPSASEDKYIDRIYIVT